ncbi:hypothetical protein FA15DRAFT_584624 [Coprinopsis marcescibilis]|uniref:Uncharacterized protein n=1 Tax=Coprinopsis marcescibilis TaxID=230819 RepID=A0A5C3L6E1_COPMA|nr:hypothetical protein FA15DRAFT_584624 [Coprinopsis marcescibilis]
MVPGSVAPAEPYDDDDDDAAEEPAANPRRTVTSPQPNRLRQFALIFFFLLSLWLAYAVRHHLEWKKKRPQIVYASRYSKEYKYRPAASPIITETLKDGRILLRGATPLSEEPTPTPAPTRRRRRIRKKRAKGGKK